MKNIIKLNKSIGWTLIIGILITQFFITKIAFEMGRMAPFIALLTAILFFPFTITAIAGILNRELYLNKIKTGIKIGIFFQVALPIILPLFFDKEFIYISLAGVILGGIMWYLKKRIEIQLLILNGIGSIVCVFISLLSLMNN